MKRINAIIERASDGTYSVYQDDTDMTYLITGTGHTVDEAVRCFHEGYKDMKSYYEKKGKPFEEVEFVFKYDVSSFLSYYSKAFSLAGLSRITGINQGQLSHYLTGRRSPSPRTVRRIEDSIHTFAQNLLQVRFS